MGGLNGTVADQKIIMQIALLFVKDVLKKSLIGNDVGIILSHNHPSGNLEPSEADITITNRIKEAGKLLDINLLDHLVITADGYYSFADEGKI